VGRHLPATVYALLALHAVGFAATIRDGECLAARTTSWSSRRSLIAQPALSATRDTVLAVRALSTPAPRRRSGVGARRPTGWW